MPAESPRIASETRFFLRLGLGLLWLSALCCVWEFLAQQEPGSPLHFGVLVGPIVQLRNFAFGLGTTSILLGLMLPHVHPPGCGRIVRYAWLLGCVLHTFALAQAAAYGMLGVQAFDPRSLARLIVYERALGHLLSWGAFSAIGLRAGFGLRIVGRSK